MPKIGEVRDRGFANDNCLAGMRCPQCKSYGPFMIEVMLWVEMTDDGCDFSETNDSDWDENSRIACPLCSTQGTVKDFTEKKKKGGK